MKKVLLILMTIMFTACGAKEEANNDVPDPVPGDPEIFEEYDLDDEFHILRMLTYEETLEKLQEAGTHVVYFGWSTCPWCAAYVPYFDRVGRAEGLEVIWKLDVREIRGVVEDPQTGEFSLSSEFQAIVDILGTENIITTQRPVGCEGEECQELPWFTVPALFVVRDGNVLGRHIGAIAGHTRVDDMLPPLDAEQEAELVEVLEALYALVL